MKRGKQRDQMGGCLISLSFVCVCVCVCDVLSLVRLFATPWTVAHQTPLSVELSRQAYRNGLPSPPLGGLPGPGIKPRSLESPALAVKFLTSVTAGKPWSGLEVATFDHV